MTNIRTVATIAFLLTTGSEAAIAMSPQELPAEVKSCKAINNNKERLKCFDGLFGETSKPQRLPEEKQIKEPTEEKQVKEPTEEKQANWSIDEIKSTDGIPRVVAANLVGDSTMYGSNHGSCLFDAV